MLGGAPASILGDIAMPSAQPSYADTVQAASQATSNFPARPSVPGSMPAAPQPASNFPARPSPSVAGIPAAPAQPAVDMAEMAKQYGMYRPGTVPKSMLDLEMRPVTPAPVAPPVQPVAAAACARSAYTATCAASAVCAASCTASGQYGHGRMAGQGKHRHCNGWLTTHTQS
jgi:hypothetical protein